jgi:hypothetical protein
MIIVLVIGERMFFCKAINSFRLDNVYYLVFCFLLVCVDQKWTLMEKDEDFAEVA